LGAPEISVAVDVLISIESGVIGTSITRWSLLGMEIVTTDEVVTGGIVSPFGGCAAPWGDVRVGLGITGENGGDGISGNTSHGGEWLGITWGDLSVNWGSVSGSKGDFVNVLLVGGREDLTGWDI